MVHSIRRVYGGFAKGKMMYKKLVTALCQEHGITLIEVDSNMKLGELAGLCKIDQEGKARKVVKCSAAVICNWGSLLTS